jgi:hypothetical protein
MVKVIRASVLILLLACSAQAGYMQNDAPAPLPPPPSSPANAAPEPTDATQEPTANSIMQNDAAESITQITLDVLAALQSLL